MKTKAILFMFCLVAFQGLNAQLVEIEADASPNSELVINSVSDSKRTVTIEADEDDTGSVAIYAKAFDVTGFGDSSYGIIADANFNAAPSFSYAIFGSSLRTTASFDGRTYGVRGNAGNATPGANYGIFGTLLGTNSGSAVLGYDVVGSPGWNEVTPNGTSYAGYFRGKGYFHDNLGIGEDDPQEKIHVDGGNIYVAGSVNGIILDSGSGCFLITVDAAGVLQTTSVTCP